MRSSRALVSTVAFAFLAASLAGVFAHDHGVGTELEAFACALDHEGNELPIAHPTAAFDEAAPAHEHECVACHLKRSRATMALPMPVHASPALEPERAAIPSSRSLLGHTSTRSARGPPRA